MTLKNTFKSELESLHSGLIEINDWMYENPETGFEERQIPIQISMNMSCIMFIKQIHKYTIIMEKKIIELIILWLILILVHN